MFTSVFIQKQSMVLMPFKRLRFVEIRESGKYRDSGNIVKSGILWHSKWHNSVFLHNIGSKLCTRVNRIVLSYILLFLIKKKNVEFIC